MVGKMMRTCYNKRRTRLELRELPRLEVVHDGWQRQVQSLPQRIPHANPSPTNSSCPSYGTAVATAPTTGQAFYEEMTAAQAAMKLAKTLAVNPVPRPHPSSSNGIPDMEAVLQNLEENIQSNLQDAARPPQAQVPPQQDTAQIPTAQQPTSAAQAPVPRPTSSTPASPQSPASPVQATQAARSPDLQEPADSMMNASLARLRNSIK